MKVSKKDVSTALFGVSVLGVIATAVVSAFDTKRAFRANDRALEGDVINKKDLALQIAKCYIPTAAVATGTIACAVTAKVMKDKLHAKDMAAMATIVSSTAYAANKYREKILEYAPEGVLKDIEKEIADERRQAKSIPTFGKTDLKEYTGDEEIRCIDTFTGVEFITTKLAFQTAYLLLNQQFAMDSYVGLKTFYNIQGVELPEEFEEYCWDWMDFQDGYVFIEICTRVKTDEKGKYYEIVYTQDPMLGDRDVRD